jgi:hypothetical protein
MKRLVETRFEDGGTLLVEVEDDIAAVPPSGTVRRGIQPGQVSERARTGFEDAVKVVAPTAEKLIAQLRGIDQAPDLVTLQFGLRMTAAAGVVLAAAGVEANFQISMVWQRTPGAPIT